MLNIAIASLQSTLTALPFIERYAGLTFPITRQVEIGETEDGRAIIAEERYPVAYGVTGATCWEQGLYLSLVPNSAHKSVFYWETLSGMSLVSVDGPKSHIWTFQGTARLVGWMNLQKLVVDNGSGEGLHQVAGLLLLQIIDALLGPKKTFTPAGIPNAQVTVELIRQVPKSAKEIFGQYTYGGMDSWQLFPLDFLAADFRITLKVNRACLDDVELLAALGCLPEL